MANRNQFERDQHEERGQGRHHYEIGGHRYSDEEYQRENRNARLPRNQQSHFESDDERRQRAMYSRHRDEDQRSLPMHSRNEHPQQHHQGGWQGNRNQPMNARDGWETRDRGNMGRNQYNDDDDNRQGRNRRDEEENRRRNNNQGGQRSNEPRDFYNREGGEVGNGRYNQYGDKGNGRYGQDNQNQGGRYGGISGQQPSGQQSWGRNRDHEQNSRRNPNQGRDNW